MLLGEPYVYLIYHQYIQKKNNSLNCLQFKNINQSLQDLFQLIEQNRF